MIHRKYLVTIIIFNLILYGCSTTDSKALSSNNLPSQIYASAKQKLQDGNYNVAIQELEKLHSCDFLGPYEQQVQLDLIYAYYKLKELSLAHESTERFLRLNPTHINTDYALYILGLTDMELDNNELHKIFGIDHSDRDPKYARDSLNCFNKLIHLYPNSEYYEDANKRLIYLRERLASYELAIVDYYNKRRAYIAVIHRVEQMIQDFPDTLATRKSLGYMKIAYQQLCLLEQANKVEKIIAANK